MTNNKQAFLAQEDDVLPLVVGELVGVSNLKVVDELDEVAMTVLAMVLGAQLRQLTLALEVVDADLALQQFLHSSAQLWEECRYGGCRRYTASSC